MKSNSIQLALLINLFVILITTISSKALEFDIIRTKSKANFNKVNKRMLTEKDLLVEYQEGEDYFLINLSLGSPAQTFPVQIDPSLSLTWVPSYLTTKNITKFEIKDSPTLKLTNQTIIIDDEDGLVSGFAAYDTVSIESISSQNFGFVLVKDYEKKYGYTDYAQGKLGLGYNNPLSTEFSFLDALKKSGAIDKRMFGLSEFNDTHGRLHLGDFPSEFSNKSPNYTICNVTSNEGLEDKYRDGWICGLSHLMIGSFNNNFNTSKVIEARALFDSAYSYISVPDIYLPHFKKELANIGLNLNTCREIKDRYEQITFICPTSVRNVNLVENALTFVINGYGYQVTLDDLFDDLDEKNSEFLVRFNREKADIWNLGHPFLCKFFSVYNQEEGTVGFYGENRVNFRKEYQNYLNREQEVITKNKFVYLVIGACFLGFTLILIVVFLIVHSIKRKRLEEHGPLISE